MKKIFSFLFFILSPLVLLYSQDQHNIDSLQNEIKKFDSKKTNTSFSLIDSTKANLQYQISKLYWDSDPDKSMIFAEQCLSLSQKINYDKGIGNGYASMGVINEVKGNYPEALDYYQKSLKLREALGNKKDIASSHINTGNIYNYQGNYTEATKQYYEALKIFEELKDENKIATLYNNIGCIYIQLRNYEEALKNLNLSLKKREEIGNSSDISDTYINIGNVNNLKGNNTEALKNYYQALSICEKKNDKQSIAILYGNIGKINEAQHDYSLAIKNLVLSLKIKEDMKDKLGMANSNITIGGVYDAIDDYQNSIKYESIGLSLAQEIGAYDLIKQAYEKLAIINANHKDYKSAYENYVLFKKTNDTLFNSENANKLTQLKMQYDYDKKDAIAKEEQTKKDELSKTEIKQQTFQRNAFIAGFALMLVFAGITFRNFKRKQKDNVIITKQKELVENQKHMVEEKNKEITQSIEYALRIQSAILPSNRFVNQHLENSFILYKPKDIVAGDFYWMEAVGDIILLAACDCTGHGVPGALVSVVCHNALNRAVREFGLTQPALILDKTAEMVIENFSKNESGIKDGMDVSLISIKYDSPNKKAELEYAGANNSLWLIQNGELIETKADKQPIGMHENYHPFANHQIQLNKGDRVYLFTDGFADQFGGETGAKKLTRKRFKDLLLSIHHKPMQEQGVLLDKFITDYRKEVEQIDDILVMGVKV